MTSWRKDRGIEEQVTVSSGPKTMREVVDGLVNEGAEAIRELQDLRYAVRVILRNLGQVALASRRFCVVLATVPTPPEPSISTSAEAVRERAVQLSELAEQVEAAFGEVDAQIRTWGIPAEKEDPTPLLN